MTTTRAPWAAELEGSVNAVLFQQARRNEQFMALVRVVAMGFVGLVHFTAWALPTLDENLHHHPEPFYVTMAWFGWGLMLYLALRQGFYRPWLVYAVPTMDAISSYVICWALWDRGHTPDLTLLGTLMTEPTVCIFIAISGGLRYSRAGTLYATFLSFVLAFAVTAMFNVPVYAALVPGTVIVGIGFAVWMMASITRRAAYGEVEKNILQRFIPGGQVQADALSELLEPKQVRATILLTDLRGFTQRSEKLAPTEVLAFLNDVQGALAEAVRRHGGIVDKFLGDGMLASFGALSADPQHAGHALRAAREMLELMKTREVQIGIGIHTGDVVVGLLGTGTRIERTILGDTVNTAARLEALCKETSVPVMISESTVTAAGDHDSIPGVREVGTFELRGRDEKIRAYTL